MPVIQEVQDMQLCEARPLQNLVCTAGRGRRRLRGMPVAPVPRVPGRVRLVPERSCTMIPVRRMAAWKVFLQETSGLGT